MPRRILIVDDNGLNRMLLKNALSDYEIAEAADGGEALSYICKNYKTLSAVLLDIMMPVMDGYEVLRRMRENPLLAQLPVIVVTGSEDEQSRVKALSLGANDFVAKPYNPEIIKHCLRNTIALRETASIINAIQRDKLTGLFNREFFFEKADELIKNQAPGHYILSCFDIDNFKLINDQYGTAEGDRILKHIGMGLKKAFESEHGVCGRISGDNFAGLYPNDPEVIERIERKHMPYIIPHNINSNLSLSIGRYVVSDKSLHASAMYDRAYMAKQSVKSRYDRHIAYFDDSMLEQLVKGQQIIGDMDAAISSHQFEVWFQPQYNHSTGALSGAEALVRWRHPQKGLIPPGDFIPVFEQYGSIYELDKYVWENTCRYLYKWIGEGRNPLPVSVNISRYDVFKEDLVDVLTGLLKKYSLPVELLRLEITESAFSKSTDQITAIINRLISLGFTVEIDDFGSGYSSLNTLKDVPAQILKLDMRFLEDSENSRRGGNILESIVRMSKWLGMSVIAEGVETKAQADFLESIGCVFVQGYYYARPMPVEAYEELALNAAKDRSIAAMETVDSMRPDEFWSPNSLDTLIFTSYVGGACVMELQGSNCEIVRANRRYLEAIRTPKTIEEVLRCDPLDTFSPEDRATFIAQVEEAAETGNEFRGEFWKTLVEDDPVHSEYVRYIGRVIAQTMGRKVVYVLMENITAQKQAEQLMEALSEQLQTIMRNINSGVAAYTIHDGVTNYIFANDKYYGQLGYTREEYEKSFTGQLKSLYPDDLEMVVERTRRANAELKPFSLDYRIVRKDGEVRWMHSDISFTSIPDVSEPVQLAVISDITDERAVNERVNFLNDMSHAVLAQPDTEAGMNGMLQKLLAYFDANRVYVFEFDEEKRIANNTYEVCAAGVSREIDNLQNVPLDVISFWIGAFAEQDFLDIADVEALPEHRPERKVLLPQGIKSLVAAPLRRDGKLIGFIGVDDARRNHSEIQRLSALGDYISVLLTRRDYEAMLSDSARTLSQMVQDMPGGYVKMRITSSGVVPEFLNDEFCRICGMTHDETMALYGDSAYTGVHPDDVEPVNKLINEAIANRTTVTLRVRLATKAGGYVPLQVFYRVTEDAAGRLYLNGYYSELAGLERLEKQRRLLLDNLPCGAGVYEFDGKKLSVVHLNARYWELVGRKKGDRHFDSILDMVHPDDREFARAEFTRAVNGSRYCEYDLRILVAGDRYKPFHCIERIAEANDGKCLVYAAYMPISDDAMAYREMLPVALSAVIDASNDYAYIKDRSFKYVCCNERLARAAGLESAGEIVGKTDYDMLSAEYADEFRAQDERVLETKEAQCIYDTAMPVAGGGIRRCDTYKYPLLDSRGKAIGLYCVIRDITKERETQNQLKLLTNSIPGGIATYACTIDDAGGVHTRLTYFNDGFCKLFGFSREEYERLSARNTFVNISESDVPRLAAQVEALVKDGRAIDDVYCIQVNGNGVKWLNFKAITSDRLGDTLFVNAMIVDVTEQYETIEKLRMSEAENRLAIQHSGGIIGKFDIAARTITMSAEAAKMLGLPPTLEDVPKGAVQNGLVALESVKTYTDFFRNITEGQENCEALYEYLTSDGWRWKEARSSTVFDGSGRPMFAIISFFDVTDRVEKEAIVRKWQQSLEEKKPESYALYRCNISRDASYDTHRGSLLDFNFDPAEISFNDKARDYAMQCVNVADRARYIEFVNSDTMLAEYYRGRRYDSIEYREDMEDGGVRWLKLTIELVEFPNSKDVAAYLLYENVDERKREELKNKERAETDPLTGLLNRSAFIDELNRRIGKHRGNPPLCALFMLDLDGFKLVNDVFGHAIGDETLIEIGQKLRSVLRKDDLVCRLGGDEFLVALCEASDRGVIEERARQLGALLHRSFSLEVQLSASLGIAVYPEDGRDFETLYAKADAALYHVKESGKDSFAFFEEGMDGEKHAPREEEPSSAAAPVKRAVPKRRMLIVDDNAMNLSFLTNIFDDEFIVDTATEGTAALIRLRRYGSAISVVLLDLMMPGMDGFAVLQKMRENIAMQTIPVIVVSGMNERETGLKAIKAGASDFVTKPVDGELLRLRVASAISKAENERLRAQNRYLAMQNEEAKRLDEAKAKSEELTIALHAAERADLAKSQFLSSMSHEIRTPLNAVIGYNTIARGEMAGAHTDAERRQAEMKVLDCLTKSDVASRHLLTIINDVLDMSAIESGKMKMEHTAFDFKSLITSLTVMFFSQARSKGVNFEVLFDKPIEEWFVGDMMRINQVLTNLLSNAVKFTPEGGSVTLTVTEREIQGESAAFRFVVSDTGIGMTKEYLGHIWTPFEQAESSVARRFGGTGLGLSITKNLVDLMGGTISVESESGAGSTFTVDITLGRMEQPKKQASYDFSGINALVVDDETSTCDYIKLLFDRCGASCRAVTSGEEAIAVFERAQRSDKPFTVCMVDWRMPKMDGITTVGEIRRIAGNDLPIIVVTAYDFSEIAEHAGEAGINKFISKPLFQSSLFDLLANICGRERPQRVEKSAKYDFGGARVLLCEDNNMNMEVARRILVSAGLAVDSAWNGQEAVTIFGASKPNTYSAILMDVHMPVIDGYEATRRIRASSHPEARSIPIIAMTADVFTEDIDEANRSGMNGHIAKPIDIELLFETLSRYIKEKTV